MPGALHDVMLVLSRKVGERILIGDQVTVTVVRITGGGVRLGIEAPPEMAVIREELQSDLRDHEAPPVGRPGERR
jgi:carbon storage regulator